MQFEFDRFHKYLDYGDWSEVTTFVEAGVLAVFELGFHFAAQAAMAALLGLG